MNEVVNSINSRNVNKAVGHDNVPAYFIKIAATTVALYLQRFIDFSPTCMEYFPKTLRLLQLYHFIKKTTKQILIKTCILD